MAWVYFRYQKGGPTADTASASERYISAIEIEVELRNYLEIEIEFNVIEIELKLTNELTIEAELC